MNQPNENNPFPTEKDFNKCFVIVIEKDGSHYLCIPKDDDAVFSAKAVDAMMNTLAVLKEPSVVLRAVLWVERKLRRVSRKIFGEAA